MNWEIEATITVDADTKHEAIEKLHHALHTETTALCCKPHANTNNLQLLGWQAKEI